MHKHPLSSETQQNNDSETLASVAMEKLMADLAQQTPDLLQRMQLNLPLPRPTLKLIRTLARLTARPEVQFVNGSDSA